MPGRTRPTTCGAWLWAASIQFFVAQVVVALRWTTPYSLARNYVSDLGATAGSPWHAGMNASFILLGVTMSVGAILVAGAYRAGWGRGVALALIAVAGAGVFLVGLFPENENIRAHTLGAGLNFVCGNLGLVVLGSVGIAGATSRRFDGFTAALGTLGLIGTALFASENFLGFGPGGMERVAAYALPVGLIVIGVKVLRA